MNTRTLKGFLIYLLFLIIFVLITFAPYVYAKVQELKATESLEITAFLEIFDPVAIATIILAAATFALAKDSGKNIEISKNNLLEEHLAREMEELIKPIYMKRDHLESLEYVHIPYYNETISFERWTEESDDFWKLLEADRYLAPKDLREIIRDYSQANKEWHKKRGELANKIRDALTKENKRELCEEAPTDRYLRITPGYFDYRFINLPPSDNKAERKEKIKVLTDRLEPNSDSSNIIKEFVKLIDEDTVLEEKRALFKEKVTVRYEELEKMIDQIRDTLEKSS
jgi:hypothetical protein